MCKFRHYNYNNKILYSNNLQSCEPTSGFINTPKMQIMLFMSSVNNEYLQYVHVSKLFSVGGEGSEINSSKY